MIPFDDEELEYIARLDARADADLLRRELPSLRDSCLRTMEVSTTLLQVRWWLSRCCWPPTHCAVHAEQAVISSAGGEQATA